MESKHTLVLRSSHSRVCVDLVKYAHHASTWPDQRTAGVDFDVRQNIMTRYNMRRPLNARAMAVRSFDAAGQRHIWLFVIL